MILVDVGLIESKALSVSGDRAFDAAKILLCFFVWPTMSILQKILNPVLLLRLIPGRSLI